MINPNTGTLTAHKALAHCRALAQSGWESAQSAADGLEQSITPVKLSRVKTASMAGIYSLRLTQDSGLLDRTIDLERFIQVLQDSNEQFIKFYSVSTNKGRTLVTVSDDLERPLAITAVKGTPTDPSSVASGAVGFLKGSRALEICETLITADWESACIAAESLTISTSQDIPLWLATPQTLGRHYADRATHDENSSRMGIDMERFSQVMASLAPDAMIRIFHVFDAYGWQTTVAVSDDLAEALGCVAIKRRL
ncbi:hypothetical protein [Streptomyces shenzhenensis]|uniref:hypothetical protein n=1 Tax=Streptomyces shenzhenensis TaxID=943815 RepID=UPI001F283B2F|nr:hypothetical protein [Streptomyces shenzhenensis]